MVDVTVPPISLAVPAALDNSEGFSRYFPAVPADLAYLNYLSGLGVTARNLLSGSLQNAVTSGTLTEGSESLIFDGSDYLDLKIDQPSGDHTMIVVASAPSTAVNSYLLNNLQSGVAGTSIHWTVVSGQVRPDWVLSHSGTTLQTLSGSTRAVGTGPHFICCRYNATSLLRTMNVFRKSTALLPVGADIIGSSTVTATLPAALTTSTTNKMRIGRTLSLTTGESIVQAAGIWNRELTDDEMVAQYLQMRQAVMNRDPSVIF